MSHMYITHVSDIDMTFNTHYYYVFVAGMNKLNSIQYLSFIVTTSVHADNLLSSSLVMLIHPFVINSMYHLNRLVSIDFS